MPSAPGPVIIMLGACLLACCAPASPPLAAPAATPTGGRSDAAVEPPRSAADLLAAEQIAYQAARPVFARRCGRCHVPRRGMSVITSNTLDLSGYPFTGSVAAVAGYAIVGALGAQFTDLDELDRRDVFQQPWPAAAARMPQDDPGTVTGLDLELIVAWAQAWRRADRAGVHDAPAPAAP